MRGQSCRRLAVHSGVHADCDMFLTMDAIWIQAAAAAIAATATIAGVFFAARQDARATRTELQQSIERFISPKLDAMDAHIRHLDDKLEGVSQEVGRLDEKVGRLDEKVSRLDEKVGRLDEKVEELDGKVEELGRDVGILGKDVAFLRGRQEERDRASS